MKRITFCIVSAIAAAVSAADWPQYRGPNRDDVSKETGLLKSWPAGGPKLLWTYTDAGVGLSGPAVVDGRLYTIGARGDSEFVYALDLRAAKDGKVPQLWAARIGPKFDFKSNNWSSGPSATPTVDGDVLYALGGSGILICVEIATGKERWRSDLAADLSAEVNPIGGGPKKQGWGFTWSPLVVGDQLIVTPGGPKGTVAALDKKTGKAIWQSAELTDQAAYTSPVAATIHGVAQYVVLTNQGLAGVSAKNGKLLWKFPARLGTEVINTPIVVDNLVYYTVGTANGNALVKVESDGGKFKAESVYVGKDLLNHHGGVVLLDGKVYGHGGRVWVCQDYKTGKVVWMDRKFPSGSLTYADGRFYCFAEGDGSVALVDVSSGEWKETGCFKVPAKTTLRKPRGQIWTPPVVADGKLFLRDQDLIFCYDVSEKK